jgi:hypothetical protein
MDAFIKQMTLRVGNEDAKNDRPNKLKSLLANVDILAGDGKHRCCNILTAVHSAAVCTNCGKLKGAALR